MSDLTGPVSFGLRIFRNYDGKGSMFGDVYPWEEETSSLLVLSLFSFAANNYFECGEIC